MAVARSPMMAFHRLFLISCLLVLPVSATEVMRRPDRFQEKANTFATERNPKINVVQNRAGSKVSFAYFTNWGIYAANFQPTDILPSPLTHILYAFADTDSSSGAIKLTDTYSDEEKHYHGDSWSDTGKNLYGNLKQLYLLKLKQRNIKVLLSIGGWTYSQAGHFAFVTSPSARATFVSDAVKLIEDYGLDGIDIDYEYPDTSDLAQGLADLVTELRTAVNNLKAEKSDATSYLITLAVACGPKHYSNYKVSQMNSAIDHWNLMAYDYAGSWLAWADNQANMYGGERTGFKTDAAVQWYLANGASPEKINIGMPLYGRAFQNTDGLGHPYSGIGPGTTEAGIYSYKFLPLVGAQVYENTTDFSSYSYDSSKKESVSYDTPSIVTLKANYVISHGLGGSMFWELSMDKVGSDSLVATVASKFGSLDQSPNHINFPKSKWDNIRNNMKDSNTSTPGITASKTTTALPTTSMTASTNTTTPPTTTISASETTTTPPTMSSSTNTTSTPTTTPGMVHCAGTAAWSSTVAYPGNAKVTYNGHLWTARWWSQADVPGGAGVWVDNGPC